MSKPKVKIEIEVDKDIYDIFVSEALAKYKVELTEKIRKSKLPGLNKVIVYALINEDKT